MKSWKYELKILVLLVDFPPARRVPQEVVESCCVPLNTCDFQRPARWMCNSIIPCAANCVAPPILPECNANSLGVLPALSTIILNPTLASIRVKCSTLPSHVSSSTGFLLEGEVVRQGAPPVSNTSRSATHQANPRNRSPSRFDLL